MSLFGKKIHADGRAGVVFGTDTVHHAAITLTRGEKPRVSGLKSFSLGENGMDVGAFRHALNRDDLRLPTSALLNIPDYQLLLVEAPDVRPDELRSAVRWRIKDLLNFHIDDAVIDVFEIPDQRQHQRNRMMYAVAARSSAIRQRADILEGAGLPISVIDIPEMALRNLAMLQPAEQAGLALLHLEEERGLITISRQGTLFLTRRWETGLRHIREADDDQRVNLFDNILLEIQRSLDYYDSHFPHGVAAEIALTSPAFNIPGLVNYLGEHLSPSIRELVMSELLEGCGDVTESSELLAIGAALRYEERTL